jgi:hypothetical protein
LFTDQPTTPTRVEALIDFLRQANANRKFTRAALYRAFQPEVLPGARADSAKQATETIRAAIELGLVSEDDAGAVKLSFQRSDSRSTREVVLDAIDARVLSTVEVEPYFSPFYSYLLYLGPKGAIHQTAKDWAIAFERDVYGGERPQNPFNHAKYDGLKRWYCYAGLGWEDPSGVFQPNPHERIRRALREVFERDRRLSSDEFMTRLSRTCPEVDGGEIFSGANRAYNADHRTCSLGLSQALLELHEDGVLRLDCPRDARGWSLAAAQPVYDGDTLLADKIAFVELQREDR